jgi:protein involved in polysaccharide export with SLBB domain
MVRILRIFSILLFTFCFLELSAQQQQSNINIDQLSDQQLQQYMNQSNMTGLSDAQLEAKAKANGLSDEQILKLKARVSQLNNKVGAGTQGNPDSYERGNATGENLSRRDSLQANKKEPKSKVFGAEFFSNQNLTFEPNLKIATPSNYILGPGDKVSIDIYGYSEAQYKLEVSPDGSIRIPNVGPILVSGLSMEEAKVKIKRQLSKLYGDMNSGKTSFQMVLTTIRSIGVTLIGEVMHPGTYTLPSLATIANALYVSGGPSNNGSFRAIDLVRNGKKVATFDFYDFLLHGDLSKNRILRDQDVIRVNAYTTRVELTGAVKRQAIFEVKENENLQDVLGFAGGFADTANKELITVYRVAGREKEIVNVSGTKLDIFSLETGDSIAVNGIIHRFKNRVSIQGAVFYEGNYSLTQASNLKDLLQFAQLKESAFMKRGVIRRLQDDYTPSFIDFNINDVQSGKLDIPLLREDSVHIYEVTDTREKYVVHINGEINKPGEFNFADQMKLQDLVLAAGGFKDGASNKRLEISRRIRNSDTTNNAAILYAIVKVVDLNKDFSPADELVNYELQPFDIVSVRKSPTYKEQVMVRIEGEVNYPGEYTIQSGIEKLSDLVVRAGGLKIEAYPTGALLKRNTFETAAVKDTSLATTKLKILNKQSTDSSTFNRENNATSLTDTQKPVGIRLQEAIQRPGSLYDIYLEEGDVLKIPKQLQTVQTFGAVSVPQKIVYFPGMRLKNAVLESGGYSLGAMKVRSYVVQANGEVKGRHHYLLFHSNPLLLPGAEVYVPTRRKTSLAEIASTGAAFASITALVLSLIYLFKK